MEQIKENGKVIAEIAKDSDEAFWIDTKEKCDQAIKAENRNIKINQAIIKLCLEHLR